MVLRPGVLRPGLLNPDVLRPGLIRPGVLHPAVLNAGVLRPGGLTSRGLTSTPENRIFSVSPQVSLSVFSLVPDLLFDCSRVAYLNTQKYGLFCSLGSCINRSYDQGFYIQA